MTTDLDMLLAACLESPHDDGPVSALVDMLIDHPERVAPAVVGLLRGPRKVHLVMSGSYSDYSFEAAFSTAEKAEEYMGGHPDEFEMIEAVLDSDQSIVFGQCWRVHLCLDGSHYLRPNEEGTLDRVPVEHRSGERGEGITHHYGSWVTDRSEMFSGKSFVSYEHALKLAAEQRQKALREHPEWFVDAKPAVVTEAPRRSYNDS